MSLPLYSELRQFQQDVIDASQIMYKEFHVLVGHTSQRIPGTDRFIIMGHLHPFGRGMNGVLSLDQLVVMDTNLNKISGKWEKMNESEVHAAIYRARPDVNGVAYVHPFYADIFAGLNMPIPTYGENIPIWDSKGAIADRERGEGMIKAMGKADAILLRNPHSLVTAASNVRNAAVMAAFIEGVAKRDHYALTLEGQKYVETIKGDTRRKPRYPFPGFSYHVDEFNIPVIHFDLWQELCERHLGARGVDELKTES
ncbi:MAG: class II aldolase/adducin family protein [Thaumarchaeota archaeon]|nr:class II aldolase/adducin family protein [Nitrososphaerota archaeon]MDG6905889.1 class II aldolase/adducin family protein [Nitrososphaerota archaeon]